jgi:hypothetical protein
MFNIRFLPARLRLLIATLAIALVGLPAGIAVGAPVAQPAASGPVAPCLELIGSHTFTGSPLASSCLDSTGMVRPLDISVDGDFSASGAGVTVKLQSVGIITVQADPAKPDATVIQPNQLLELPFDKAGTVTRINPSAVVSVTVESNLPEFTLNVKPPVAAPTPAPAPTSGAAQLVASALPPVEVAVTEVLSDTGIALKNGDNIKWSKALTATTIIFEPSDPNTVFSLDGTSQLVSKVYTDTLGTKGSYQIRTTSVSGNFTVVSGNATLRVKIIGQPGKPDKATFTVTSKANATAASSIADTGAPAPLPNTAAFDVAGNGPTLASPNTNNLKGDEAKWKMPWHLAIPAALVVLIASLATLGALHRQRIITLPIPIPQRRRD